MRRASSTTMRSGVITSRTDTCSLSRRISFIAMRLRTRRWTSSKTSVPGSATSRTARANGRAASRIRPCWGKTFSSHQRATSGNDSSRSVSPVGAQSTMTHVVVARLVVALDLQQAEQLVHAGRHRELLGADAVHAAGDEQVAEPVLHAGPVALHLCWAADLLGPQGSPTGGRLAPSGCSSASASECAGSVHRTTVRRPAAAHRRAVAAATDVLPTPPLPVYRIVLGAAKGPDPSWTCAVSPRAVRRARRSPSPRCRPGRPRARAPRAVRPWPA